MLTWSSVASYFIHLYCMWHRQHSRRTYVRIFGWNFHVCHEQDTLYCIIFVCYLIIIRIRDINVNRLFVFKDHLPWITMIEIHISLMYSSISHDVRNASRYSLLTITLLKFCYHTLCFLHSFLKPLIIFTDFIPISIY